MAWTIPLVGEGTAREPPVAVRRHVHAMHTLANDGLIDVGIHQRDAYHSATTAGLFRKRGAALNGPAPSLPAKLRG